MRFRGLVPHASAPDAESLDAAVVRHLADRIRAIYDEEPTDLGVLARAAIMTICDHLINQECRDCRREMMRDAERDLPRLIDAALRAAAQLPAGPHEGEHVH